MVKNLLSHSIISEEGLFTLKGYLHFQKGGKGDLGKYESKEGDMVLISNLGL